MGTNTHIPRWPLRPLAEVAEINPKRPPELRNLDASTQVSFVPMAAVCEKAGAITEAISRPFGEVRKGFTYFAEGDVIFAKITPCMQNGKTSVALGLVNGLGFGSTEFHVLRPTRATADWLYFFVRTKSFRDEAQRHFQGSAGQQRVPEDFMRQALIPDAPIKEQQRVVGRIKQCLSRVEDMQRLREEAEAEGTLLLSAALRELFDEAAEKGTPCSIGSVTLESQYGTNQKCAANGDGTPILRIPNVAGGRVNLEKLKFTHLSEKEGAKVRLRKGDLLVVRTNGSPDLVGRCAVFEEAGDFGYASYLIRFRFDHETVLPGYVSFFLQSPQGRDAIARIRQTSAGQYNVNSENLRNIVFPLVKPKQQAAVIQRALAVQRTADSISDELHATGQDALALRESILREAYAGNL